ncbi:MAG: WbqC family protein, partial [Gemmataceae bacterium]|nr:WbqC family protein [Gemmataceae bacterium]
WKGYFDLINLVDEFVLYDDVQFTRRDWRNRNKIKTPGGELWLTIPVQVAGKYHQTIRETLVSDPGWARTHWRSLEHAYAKAPFFKSHAEPFRALYADPPGPSLSSINRAWLEAACGLLGIKTKLADSSEYRLEEDRNARLVSICKQAGATEYWSGPAARCYLDEAAFAAEGISVRWMEYGGYPEYPQLHPPFQHGVSVLDLLFNQGPDSTRYMKSFACAYPS